jgi:Flp pilus assembly pilin Flp
LNRRSWRDESGQTISEYVVLAGMVAVLAVMLYDIVGGSAREAFRATARRLLAVVTGAPE